MPVFDGQLFHACLSCGKLDPYRIRPYKGVIYILSNPHQKGVKVGVTTKDIHERVRQLSATGVPGKFAILALFPSSRPQEDEKKAHKKLERYRIDKEHFDIDPVRAIVKIRTALNHRLPLILDKKLEDEVVDMIVRNKELMARRLGPV